MEKWDWTMRYLANHVPQKYIIITNEWLGGFHLTIDLRDLWVGADSEEMFLADAIQDHVLACEDRDALKLLLGKDS